MLLIRIDERALEDLLDEGDTVHLISEDIGKHLVVGGEEESIGDMSGCFGFGLLVDQSEHCV